MPQSDEILRANYETAFQALHDIGSLPGNDAAVALAQQAVGAIVARRMGVPEKAAAGRVLVMIPTAPQPFRTRWAKWVIAVDRKVRTGFAFEGPFLRPGIAHSLPPGAVVLMYECDDGSKRNARVLAFVVPPDGNPVEDQVLTRAVGPRWASEVRDPIADHLERRRGS